MKTTKILFLISLGFVLASCSSPAQKAQELIAGNVAEKAIEKSTGQQADVKYADRKGTVEIKTEEGRIQSGAGAELPAGFPTDIYLYKGDLVFALNNDKLGGYMITIETGDPVS